MKTSVISISIVAAIVSVVLLQGGMATTTFGARNNAFGFNARLINGFPGRSAELTGGGAFNIESKFVHSGGGFRCLSDIVAPPAFFVGCLTGQGVRWDTAALITEAQPFKCTGAATETGKTAITGSHTVVLVADFYRQGDGNDESFTARMIVSDSDLAGDIDGIQNVWIQGIGCGPAVVSFN